MAKKANMKGCIETIGSFVRVSRAVRLEDCSVVNQNIYFSIFLQKLRRAFFDRVQICQVQMHQINARFGNFFQNKFLRDFQVFLRS